MDYLNSFGWFHHSPVCYALRYELQVCFDKTRTCEMIAKLKALYAPQVKVMKFQYLDCSLSTKNFVKDYVMWRESFTFHEILAVLRTKKVEPFAGEVIDDKSIYDIRDRRWRYIWYTRYECFSLQVFVTVTKVFDAGSILWNMSFLLKSYLEGKRRWCVSMMASKMVWWPASLSLRFCYLD